MKFVTDSFHWSKRMRIPIPNQAYGARIAIVAAPRANCEKTCDHSINPRMIAGLKSFSGTTIVSPGLSFDFWNFCW